MDLLYRRMFGDLSIRSRSVQARAKSAGMGLFNLYISQQLPLTLNINPETENFGNEYCQPQMEQIFTPTGVFLWNLFHIIFLLSIIFQNPHFRKCMWPAIIIVTLWLVVFTEYMLLTGLELFTSPQEFRLIFLYCLQSIGGICIELILLIGSLDYYNILSETVQN